MKQTAHRTAGTVGLSRHASLREHLYLSFRIYRTGKVELLSGCHLPPSPLSSQGGPTTNVSCDLVSAKKDVLTTHRCHITDFHEDFDPPYRTFHEVMLWYPAATAIVFRRDRETVDTISLKGKPKHVTIAKPVAIDSNWMQLKWHPRRDENRLSYRVRFSNDGGMTWSTVAVCLTEPSYIANVNTLPGGRDCLFQIATSAGILTAVSQTEPFALPLKPREAFILTPAPDASLLSERRVVLQGFAFSPDFPSFEPDDMAWSSSIAGILGTGPEVIVPTLRPGHHIISLTVPDGLGGQAIATVRIAIGRSSH
jgi:hypothetical protein